MRISNGVVSLASNEMVKQFANEFHDVCYIPISNNITDFSTCCRPLTSSRTPLLESRDEESRIVQNSSLK
jgi:hypothetical protein